ncbi:ABC transporter permease [Roseospira visakhapatnamensis]|uniref:Ribose transport system permease protein n=1 Tax=Roseospira visakhapatnamensis TaxID=390880 RepID=A0A7W6WAE0_9PROT|nr:ABC transporter permease [Roseospira visakhapatnamensis]MBB4266387.1 ribose transport system permease protein [Roseospira visakhapatnamensis]
MPGLKMKSSALLRLALSQSTLVFFVVMLIAAYFLSDRFFTPDNVTNILRQSVPLGVVSIGLLYVILTGGIDLSVGSVMALVSVVVALTLPDLGLTGAIIVSLAVGTCAGLVSGSLVAYFGIAPFIATLAIMTIARGVALIVSRGQPIFVDNDTFMSFGSSSFLGVPSLFLVLIGVTLLAALLYRQTVFGRLVIAVGSNEVATRFAGINIPTIKVAVYALSGFTCAIAGIISATRTGVGSPILAIGFELDAIAAVVVGGASLAGGRGTVINTLIGALILSIISNLMNLMDIPGYHQQVVKGVIIVLAVLMESAKRRLIDR